MKQRGFFAFPMSRSGSFILPVAFEHALMVTHSFCVLHPSADFSKLGCQGFLWEKLVVKASLIAVKNLVKTVATVTDEGLILGD